MWMKCASGLLLSQCFLFLVQNVVGAASPILCITFDFFSALNTSQETHWLYACRYNSPEPGWHFNVTDIFIRSQYQPRSLCLYNSSQQSTTRNQIVVLYFISWKNVCLMWASAVAIYCANLGGSSTVSLKIRKPCRISGLIGTIKAYLSALEQSAVTVNYSSKAAQGAATGE